MCIYNRPLCESHAHCCGKDRCESITPIQYQVKRKKSIVQLKYKEERPLLQLKLTDVERETHRNRKRGGEKGT